MTQLCLGTVQFGMPYGICGEKQPTLHQSIAMLDYATQNGVCSIDTACAYGTAEEIIGCFLSKSMVNREKLNIISKLKPNCLDNIVEERYYDVIKEEIEQSLQRLHTDYLDGYLLHSARYVFNDNILHALSRLKDIGYVKKVGVSVYEVGEARRGILNQFIDIIQLPYSLLDQRMSKDNVFSLVSKNGVDIHTRSAFLQGLILMPENQIPDFLLEVKPILHQINDICSKENISKISLAMAFIKHQSTISRLVFGVHNIEQLKQNIELFEQSIDTTIIDEVAKICNGLGTNIIMPSLWGKKG